VTRLSRAHSALFHAAAGWPASSIGLCASGHSCRVHRGVVADAECLTCGTIRRHIHRDVRLGLRENCSILALVLLNASSGAWWASSGRRAADRLPGIRMLLTTIVLVLVSLRSREGLCQPHLRASGRSICDASTCSRGRSRASVRYDRLGPTWAGVPRTHCSVLIRVLPGP